MTESYLTDAERKVIQMAGEIMTIFAKEIIGPGKSREQYIKEIAKDVHAIQNAALAQAAGRLYPDEFRVMGDTKQ